MDLKETKTMADTSDLLNKVADLIVDVARQEDILLRRVGKGILQIPELAFAYAVGREIALNAESVFGTYKVHWRPETKISSRSGITDLVFDVDEEGAERQARGLAIEFKIGGTAVSYKDDLAKLKNIPENYEKIFCALIDAWPEDLAKDGRVRAVDSEHGVKRLCRGKFFDFFASLHEGYANQLCCIVAVWHLTKQDGATQST